MSETPCVPIPQINPLTITRGNSINTNAVFRPLYGEALGEIGNRSFRGVVKHLHKASMSDNSIRDVKANLSKRRSFSRHVDNLRTHGSGNDDRPFLAGLLPQSTYPTIVNICMRIIQWKPILCSCSSGVKDAKHIDVIDLLKVFLGELEGRLYH